jgi:hypothetical protein
VLPLKEITVKIAAIEHRTSLSIKQKGEYLGIELGADAGADVNLDDFMVFDNDAERAKAFFEALLFKHYISVKGPGSSVSPQTSKSFINMIFTQVTAFEEFVNAAGGVPRDAVYMISILARKAFGKKISVQDVREVTKEWFQRDKMAPLRANHITNELLHWIIQEVIAHRRTRAFLLPYDQKHPLIEELFDSRLLHVLKKNISSNESPGKRFDAFKLDYGCYVHLMASNKAPTGLLLSDNEMIVEVPPDDYRSIRRAILDIEKFEEKIKASSSTQN